MKRPWVFIIQILLLYATNIPAQDEYCLTIDSITGKGNSLIDTIIVNYSFNDSILNEYWKNDLFFSLYDTNQWQLLPADQTIDFRSIFTNHFSFNWLSDRQFYGASHPSIFLKLNVSSIPPESWISLSPMPVAREFFGIAQYKDRVFLIGGHNLNCTYMGMDSVTEYNPRENKWTARAPLLNIRFGLNACVVRDKIYAIGGTADTGCADTTIEEYDPALDIWKIKTALPWDHYLGGAAVVNDKIYIMGGGTYSLNVYEYDPINDTWKVNGSLRQRRAEFGICTIRNKIYLIGGILNPNLSGVDLVEEYDPINNIWQTKAPMPTPREGLTAVALNNKIYAIGGFNDSGGYLQTVEEYDPLADKWTTKPDMLEIRRGLSAFAYHNEIYVLGGANYTAKLCSVEKIRIHYSYCVHSRSLKINTPDVLSPQHNLKLAANPVADHLLRLHWSADSIFSPDADSIGIWYKTNSTIDTSMDLTLNLLGTYEIQDSTALYEGQTDSVISFKASVKDSAGNWSKASYYQYLPVGLAGDNYMKGYYVSPEIIVTPNPSTGNVKIVFKKLFGCDIYDMRGSHVRTVMHDHSSIIKTQYIWDTRNEQGSYVPNGIYLIYAKGSDNFKVVKLFLIR